MMQEMTGRNVVYTLKVVTDPNAKAELQKFKQAVQDAFKEIGPNQAEKRDQAMRGPQIDIERMQLQVQQETQRRQYDMFQHAEGLTSRPAVHSRQTMIQAGSPNHSRNIDGLAVDATTDDGASTWEAGSQINSIPTITAGNFRGKMARSMSNGDRQFGNVQKSVARVIDALAKMAQALGSSDESNSRSNALLQRANRDAVFG